ncbi:hypothetical protein GCM10022215_42540 [Nocardioides fonticola]|uniref:CHAT domain-containing protein n=1 Tax=Nocardioides fonticola TaxID=450363 RepID=A0ABP7Y2I6_9ACTN
MPKPGIFCLEGEWSRDLRERNSVLPLLELLERLKVADYIHRDVATSNEFWYYLKRWEQKGYASYRILYLASHGESGLLELGKDRVTMAELAEQMQGRAAGRVIYFGSCLSLAQYDEELLAFVKATGAKAVVGYSRAIPWLESASFELLLLERMLRNSRSDAFFNHLVRDHGAFAASLGLVVATKTRVFDA